MNNIEITALVRRATLITESHKASKHGIYVLTTDCMLGSQPNHGWQLCFPL